MISCILFALALSVCDGRDLPEVRKPADCLMSLDKGTDCGSEERFYYNVTSGKCFNFTYLGCDGNSNNFDSADQCLMECSNVTMNDTTTVAPPAPLPSGGSSSNNTSNKGNNPGEILLIVNPAENYEHDVADFENDSFGKWAESGMEIISVEVPGNSGLQLTRQGSNDTNDTAVAPAPGATTTAKVAVPKASLILAHDNGTLVRQISIQEDDHTELAFSLRVVGYKVAELNVKNQNPFFSIELLKTGNATAAGAATQVTIFDIRDYGKVFERNTDWIIIKYLFKYDPLIFGEYDLTLTSRRGNAAGSNVFLDNLSMSYITRLTQETAEKMDAAANGTITTPSPGSGNYTSTTPAPEAAGSGTYTAMVVLAVATAILILALAFISFKYWHLKNALVGTYSVSTTAQQQQQQNSPAYSNPAFSRQEHPDRYGSMHD